jgi:hypothetical protein
MKRQFAEPDSTAEKPGKEILGCDLASLEALVRSTDIEAIAQGRRQAQERLRARIDGSEVTDNG